MPRMGFELTIAAFQRTKTVHALDDTAAAIGRHKFTFIILCYSYTSA
jgi:hypothetical protein